MRYLLIGVVGWALACGVGAAATGADEAPGASPAPKKIVLIAGKKSHGPEGNGIHDYPWSVKLLKVLLDNSNVRDRVRVEYHLDGWPQDPTTLDTADSIMIVSDGRDGELYEEAPHFRNPAQMALIERQMRRGCGFLTFHFSTFAPDQYARQILDWSGAYFDWETDGVRKWHSAIRTLDAEVRLGSPDHPVSRGVKPFRLKEEFYYNLRFGENDAALRPLLVVPALEGRKPDGDVVAWARERPDGGRGFGTSCGHFYDNWRNDDFRKLLLNALVWTAKVDPPEGGVTARFFERDELIAALEGKRGAERAEVDERPIRVLLIAGNEAHKWHNWERTTPAIKGLLEVDPRIRVDVSYDIEDLATRKLSDYHVLVQNYVNWHDPKGISEAARGALLGWLRGGGGLVLVHFANGAFNFSLPQAAGSDWPEYRKIVRRVWNHQGQGEAKSGHDAFGTFTVRPTAIEHAITAGLSEFEVNDELYFRQDGDQPIEPLITARSKVTARDEPLAWVYRYGEARVFQTLLGHSEKTYDSFEAAEMLRRATAWTAGRTIVKRSPPPGAKPAATAAKPVQPAAPPSAKPVLTEGRFGKALDARRAGLVVAASADQRDAPLTVDLWARIDRADGFQILVASEEKSSATHWELYSYAASGVLSVYLPGRGGEYRSETNVADGKWRHLAMVLEPQRVRLFADGKTVLDRPLAGPPAKSAGGALGIGRLVEGTIGCAGSIDELRIVRGAHPPDGLPDARPTAVPGTVGLWRFDELVDEREAPDESPAKLPARVGAATGAPSGGAKPGRPIVAAAPDHFGVESVGFAWTENDSRDDRWQAMQLGAFQASSLPLPGGPLRKGLSIRVGSPAAATLAFDTETLRWRAAWSGEFLRFDPARYGLISPPRPAGPLFFASREAAGWTGGALQYRGLYRRDDRVVLAYDVGAVRILETPWCETTAGLLTPTRTLEIAGPAPALACHQFDLESPESLRLETAGRWRVARATTGDRRWIAATDAAGANWRASADGKSLELALEPSATTRRLKIWFAAAPADREAAWLEALDGAPPAESPASLRVPGPRRWTATIVTQGERAADDSAYVLDTLALPHDNPYRALFFVGGHDFLPDGDLALCTAHGDVWLARGVDGDLRRIEWRRFATGLFQPLGLKVHDGRIYVLGRDQITRLIDHNGDGEADEYQCVNNRAHTSFGGHDYVTCLERDADGWFYFAHATQGVVRASEDGKSYETIATGLRNPNGLGLGPNGELTASPQEGEWVPGSNIAWVRPGAYFGYGGPRVAPDRPLGYDPPLCWIPRMEDNSSGGQTWATDARWGPLAGQLLHFSFGKCRMMVVLRESVGSTLQGGVYSLPFHFASGAHRGRFSPRDGQLYVSGLKGWVSSAVQDGCLQRVRYTGKPFDGPLQVRCLTNGLAVTFTRPLDKATAEDPENYNLQQWNYRYAAAYGSADWKVSDPREEGHDTLDVRSATLLEDGRTLFLEVDPLVPAHQCELKYQLRAADGATIRSTLHYTIHAVAAERMDEAKLARRASSGLLTDEQRARLRPGLAVEYRQGERRAAGRLRFATLALPPASAPATGLAPGPFHATLGGLLQTGERGEYELRMAGRGTARLAIDGRELLTLAAAAAPADRIERTAPVAATLRKGWNRLQVDYQSPATGTARLAIEWRGAGFDWEPLPVGALVHEGPATEPLGGAGEPAATDWQLAGRHRCLACHTAPASAPADSRPADSRPLDAWLTRPAPSLARAGGRWNSAWLYAWLLDPRALRPEATMPHLLDAGSPSGRQEAADLTAYLMSLDKPAAEPPAPSATDERLAAGLALYEDLGCVGCHRRTVEPADGEPAPPRISLVRVAEKFRAGRLAEFLRRPQAHDPWRPMPDFRLDAEQAAALEAWLRKSSDGSDGSEPAAAALTAPPAGDVERGRGLFVSKRCASCHGTTDGGEAPKPVRLPLVSRPADAPPLGCLAETPDRRGAAPKLALTDAERTRLTHWARQGAATPAAFTPLEAAPALMQELRCHACHSRDGRTSPRGLLSAEEGERGLPPEVLPNLTWAGDKLQTSYLRGLISGADPRPARPWLKARMPAFPAYASWIADGLAAEHGWPLEPAPPASLDPPTVRLGDLLTQKEALDCRQCHAVGDQQPRGDKNTQIALGVNFALVRERVRPDYYGRFVLNPPRYDIGTKMPVLAPDGRTTRVDRILDGDARRQFAAVWQFIQAQPPLAEAARPATDPAPRP